MPKADPGELDTGLPYPKESSEDYPEVSRCPRHYMPCLVIFNPDPDHITLILQGCHPMILTRDDRSQFSARAWPEQCDWAHITHCAPGFLAMAIQRGLQYA